MNMVLHMPNSILQPMWTNNVIHEMRTHDAPYRWIYLCMSPLQVEILPSLLGPDDCEFLPLRHNMSYYGDGNDRRWLWHCQGCFCISEYPVMEGNTGRALEGGDFGVPIRLTWVGGGGVAWCNECICQCCVLVSCHSMIVGVDGHTTL